MIRSTNNRQNNKQDMHFKCDLDARIFINKLINDIKEGKTRTDLDQGFCEKLKSMLNNPADYKNNTINTNGIKFHVNLNGEVMIQYFYGEEQAMHSLNYFTFRPEQIDFIEALQKNNVHLAALPTGWGKTMIAANMQTSLNGSDTKIATVSPNEVLANAYQTEITRLALEAGLGECKLITKENAPNGIKSIDEIKDLQLSINQKNEDFVKQFSLPSNIQLTTCGNYIEGVTEFFIGDVFKENQTIQLYTNMDCYDVLIDGVSEMIFPDSDNLDYPHIRACVIDTALTDSSKKGDIISELKNKDKQRMVLQGYLKASLDFHINKDANIFTNRLIHLFKEDEKTFAEGKYVTINNNMTNFLRGLREKVNKFVAENKALLKQQDEFVLYESLLDVNKSLITYSVPGLIQMFKNICTTPNQETKKKIIDVMSKTTFLFDEAHHSTYMFLTLLLCKDSELQACEKSILEKFSGDTMINGFDDRVKNIITDIKSIRSLMKQSGLYDKIKTVSLTATPNFQVAQRFNIFSSELLNILDTTQQQSQEALKEIQNQLGEKLFIYTSQQKSKEQNRHVFKNQDFNPEIDTCMNAVIDRFASFTIRKDMFEKNYSRKINATDVMSLFFENDDTYTVSGATSQALIAINSKEGQKKVKDAISKIERATSYDDLVRLFGTEMCEYFGNRIRAHIIQAVQDLNLTEDDNKAIYDIIQQKSTEFFLNNLCDKIQKYKTKRAKQAFLIAIAEAKDTPYGIDDILKIDFELDRVLSDVTRLEDPNYSFKSLDNYDRRFILEEKLGIPRDKVDHILYLASCLYDNNSNSEFQDNSTFKEVERVNKRISSTLVGHPDDIGVGVDIKQMQVGVAVGVTLEEAMQHARVQKTEYSRIKKLFVAMIDDGILPEQLTDREILKQMQAYITKEGMDIEHARQLFGRINRNQPDNIGVWNVMLAGHCLHQDSLINKYLRMPVRNPHNVLYKEEFAQKHRKRQAALDDIYQNITKGSTIENAVNDVYKEKKDNQKDRHQFRKHVIKTLHDLQKNNPVNHRIILNIIASNAGTILFGDKDKKWNNFSKLIENDNLLRLISSAKPDQAKHMIENINLFTENENILHLLLSSQAMQASFLQDVDAFIKLYTMCNGDALLVKLNSYNKDCFKKVFMIYKAINPLVHSSEIKASISQLISKYEGNEKCLISIVDKIDMLFQQNLKIKDITSQQKFLTTLEKFDDFTRKLTEAEMQNLTIDQVNWILSDKGSLLLNYNKDLWSELIQNPTKINLARLQRYSSFIDIAQQQKLLSSFDIIKIFGLHGLINPKIQKLLESLLARTYSMTSKALPGAKAKYKKNMQNKDKKILINFLQAVQQSSMPNREKLYKEYEKFEEVYKDSKLVPKAEIFKNIFNTSDPKLTLGNIKYFMQYNDPFDWGLLDALSKHRIDVSKSPYNKIVEYNSSQHNTGYSLKDVLLDYNLVQQLYTVINYVEYDVNITDKKDAINYIWDNVPIAILEQALRISSHNLSHLINDLSELQEAGVEYDQDHFQDALNLRNELPHVPFTFIFYNCNLFIQDVDFYKNLNFYAHDGYMKYNHDDLQMLNEIISDCQPEGKQSISNDLNSIQDVSILREILALASMDIFIDKSLVINALSECQQDILKTIIDICHNNPDNLLTKVDTLEDFNQILKYLANNDLSYALCNSDDKFMQNMHPSFSVVELCEYYSKEKAIDVCLLLSENNIFDTELEKMLIDNPNAITGVSKIINSGVSIDYLKNFVAICIYDHDVDTDVLHRELSEINNSSFQNDLVDTYRMIKDIQQYNKTIEKNITFDVILQTLKGIQKYTFKSDLYKIATTIYNWNIQSVNTSLICKLHKINPEILNNLSKISQDNRNAILEIFARNITFLNNKKYIEKLNQNLQKIVNEKEDENTIVNHILLANEPFANLEDKNRSVLVQKHFKNKKNKKNKQNKQPENNSSQGIGHATKNTLRKPQNAKKTVENNSSSVPYNKLFEDNSNINTNQKVIVETNSNQQPIFDRNISKYPVKKDNEQSKTPYVPQNKKTGFSKKNHKEQQNTVFQFKNPNEKYSHQIHEKVHELKIAAIKDDGCSKGNTINNKKITNPILHRRFINILKNNPMCYK